MYSGEWNVAFHRFSTALSRDEIAQQVMHQYDQRLQNLQNTLKETNSVQGLSFPFRVSVVRIYPENLSLVILDEASSRLDPQTEALLENAISQLLQHRTGIIIAHRLQTIQRTDQILIVDQGKIVEYGDRYILAQQPDSRYAQMLHIKQKSD